MVKRLSTLRETRLQSLGQEDPLEKEMATYSSSLAWKIPWMEASGGVQSMGPQRVGHDWATSLFFNFQLCTGHQTNCFIFIISLNSYNSPVNETFPHFRVEDMHVCMLSYSVMSDSLQPLGQQATRLFYPWNFPDKSTGVGCHFLFQGIFLPRDWTCVSCISCIVKQIFLPLSHLQSPSWGQLSLKRTLTLSIVTDLAKFMEIEY